VAALQGKALLGDAHNGLFLAAPLRSGKPTFLQGDLRPALQSAGVVMVVYVDLWARTGHPVSVAQAQKALEALHQRMPALVWKSAHGEHALEDVAMHR